MDTYVVICILYNLFINYKTEIIKRFISLSGNCKIKILCQKYLLEKKYINDIDEIACFI